MPETRTRDDVLADIALMRRDAGRMICTDPEFEAAHGVLNDLLTELEATE